MLHPFELHRGDCLEVLRAMADNSVDSIVTDPPYGLKFMGKKWDCDVPAVEVWREALRVLKPGGYLLAFAGTRTQHRMAVRIEDAGFEIRDMIMWVYSSGFPKSHNLDNHRGKAICGCEPTAECDVRSMPGSNVSAAESTGKECGQVLQPIVPQQGAPAYGQTCRVGQDARLPQSSMEGRGDAPEAARQLRTGEVYQSSGMGHADGENGRLCDGAPTSDGEVVQLPADANGGCSPCQPRPDAQRAAKLGIVAGQPESQAVGAWPVCRGCGLQILPRGLGTALKPALEPITVARKPLIGTVAENVLTHGTGALNIDGCRVHSHDSEGYDYSVQRMAPGADQNRTGKTHQEGVEFQGRTKDGRWPANLVHDGSEEVVALFPADAGVAAPVTGAEASMASIGEITGDRARVPGAFHDDAGSAARFFYCAKASRSDRDEGCEKLVGQEIAGKGNGLSRTCQSCGAPVIGGCECPDRTFVNPSRKNHHPTVKPTDLMAYLCRLVTPTGGVVLDLYMGSGTTGKAAIQEGFRFIGIERDEDEDGKPLGYMPVAAARCTAAAQRRRDETAQQVMF